MDYNISVEDLDKYLILPNSFDWNLVDQELGFKKIFSVFPELVYLELNVESEIFRLLTKSAAHYAFVMSIPKIKVQITNFGIQEFSQDKMKSSAWWDVRDLGLSLLKVADRCFSDAISLASEDENLKAELDFFKNGNGLIDTPAAMENIYSINYSPEVFLMLQQFLKTALTTKLKKKIGACYEEALLNAELKDLMKQAVGFYGLYYASLLPAFVFTQNAVVVQYEELPWQKSQVLDPHTKMISGQNFSLMGDELLNMVMDHIAEKKTLFPCYVPPEGEFLMQARDSGIYL